SDMLSRGNSARLYNELVKRHKLFTEISAYVTGEHDEGMFIVSGKLVKGVKMEDAEQAIENELEKLRSELVSEQELTKVKNKVESTLEFSEMNILNKAMNLAIAELMGDADLVNREGERYQRVTPPMVQAEARKAFTESNASVLYYYSKN
ncbi:MAG: insulinase family protein, partial [Bacteroidota bacterium]